MKRVVILGAGFGGLAAATRLRQRLPKAFEVVIVDRRPARPPGAPVGGDKRLEGDALIIALGTQHAPEAVPGFTEHVLNVYDRAALPRASEAVRSFRGGRLRPRTFPPPPLPP